MWRIPRCLLYFWTTDSFTHIYCSTVQMKLVKYQRGIRTSKNWLFCKVRGREIFFFFLYIYYVSSMGLIQSGNNGAKLLISYTESHDVLGHLEEFHLLLWGSMWMHKFTGRADILNFAAQISLIWRRTVCTDCFIPSSPLLADNKTLPAALVPVFSVMLYYAHTWQQRLLNCSPWGMWWRIKNWWPWLSYKQLWGIKQVT